MVQHHTQDCADRTVQPRRGLQLLQHAAPQLRRAQDMLYLSKCAPKAIADPSWQVSNPAIFTYKHFLTRPACKALAHPNHGRPFASQRALPLRCCLRRSTAMPRQCQSSAMSVSCITIDFCELALRSRLTCAVTMQRT